MFKKAQAIEWLSTNKTVFFFAQSKIQLVFDGLLKQAHLTQKWGVDLRFVGIQSKAKSLMHLRCI